MRSLLPDLLAVVFGLAALLFFPAGRLDWVQARAFTLAFVGFLLFYALWVSRNDPGKLNEHCRSGQNIKDSDKIILTMCTILLLAMLVLAGLEGGFASFAPAVTPTPSPTQTPAPLLREGLVTFTRYDGQDF